MTDSLRAKRWVTALLAALLLLLGGCADSSQSVGWSDSDESKGGDTVDKTLVLARYTGEALDPFLSKSRTNVELLRLCYVGLFSVNKVYLPECELAERYEWDQNTVYIFLRSDARFSDGHPVTAADCERSYQRAKQNDSVFAQNFNWIQSFDAVSDTVFSVTFQSNGETNLNLLSIPIVRQEISEDGYYLGAGPYCLEKSGVDAVLTRNLYSFRTPQIEQIGLLDIRDQEALIYNFNYGRIHAIFSDVSEDSAELRTNGELVSFTSNQLTFLVTNSAKKDSFLSGDAFTKGVFYLLDRSALVSTALSGYGDPVWYPFNPSWQTVVAANLNQDIASVATANEYFAQAGIELSGSVRIWKDQPVVLDLIVNQETASRVAATQEIARQLTNAGFSVQVRILAWDDYLAAVEKGEFDLYLAEVLLPQNMDPVCLLTKTVCNSGKVQQDAALFSPVWHEFLAGTTDLRSVVNQFRELVPLIPLYFSRDALAVSMTVSGNFGACEGGLFSGLETWTLK